MKKYGGKTTNMYVMFALLAVLFVSLGYLSMQSNREGNTSITDSLLKKKQPFKVKEGLTKKSKIMK